MTSRRYRNRLRVRSCGLIVRNNALLLLQIRTPARPAPVWMPPGGEVRFGESLTEAVVREVREEAGLDVRPGRLSLIQEFLHSPWHAVEFYFCCEITGGTLRMGSDPERSDADQILLGAEFFPFDKLSSLEVHPEALARNPLDLTRAHGEVEHSRSGGGNG